MPWGPSDYDRNEERRRQEKAAKEEAERLKKQNETIQREQEKKERRDWYTSDRLDIGLAPGELHINKYNGVIQQLNQYRDYAKARRKLTSYLAQNPHALPNDLFNINPAGIEEVAGFYSDLQDRPWQKVETVKFNDYDNRVKNLRDRFEQLEKKYGSLPQLTQKLTRLGQTQAVVSRRILS